MRIRSPRRLIALAAVAVVVAAVVIVALVSRTHPSSNTGDAVVHKPAPGIVSVPFSDVKDYDPEADGRESPGSIKLAIDGNRTTHWATEHYTAGLAGVHKNGVGLWVSTKRPVAATELDLISPFIGWQGQIYGAKGKVPAGIGGWQKLSGTFTAKASNKIALDTANQQFDHYLVWITKLAGEQAGISELSLLAQKR